MAAADYDLEFIAGDDESRTFAFYQDDGVTTLDISGRTFVGEVRTARNQEGDPAASFITAVNGHELTVSLLAATTRALRDEQRRYFYDIQQLTPTVQTFFRGALSLTDDVTR